MSLRKILDISLRQALALPAANASAASAGVYLGTGPHLDKIEVDLNVPALPNLVDAKTATFTFKDSADGVTYAAIPELTTLVLTGAGGAGADAAQRTVRLPTSFRGWLRVDCAVQAAGGDNTAATATLDILQ